MKRFLAPAVAAAAVLLSSASIDALLAPANAQIQVQINFDTFHDRLAAYGSWVYSDRWGEVWVPDNVDVNFQPYGTNGYWVNTPEYGWLWVSNYEWGDIPFHYGRWVNDPEIGWLWIPGYQWSPAWVAWRSNGQYTGWMPMPPDPQFLGVAAPGPAIGISLFGGGLGISIDFNDTSGYYGYGQWYGPSYGEQAFAANWVFVGTAHLADPNFQQYWAPRTSYVTIIHNTTNITNYTVVNNYIVNRSVDVAVVERASGHPIPVVHAAQVIKHPEFVIRADQGRQIQEQSRRERPRGNGLANSAPPPSAKVVSSLSAKIPPRIAAHGTMHVYTRDTVVKASPAAFKGTGAPEGGKTTPPAGGGMKGPAGATTEEKVRQPSGGAMMHGPSTTTAHTTPAGTPENKPMYERKGNATGSATGTTPHETVKRPVGPGGDTANATSHKPPVQDHNTAPHKPPAEDKGKTPPNQP